MPLSDEIGELLKNFRLIGGRVFLAAKGTKLSKLMIPVEPQHPKCDDLMKRRRRKAINRRVPNQIRVWNGFDVEDEKRSGHGQKIAEMSGKIPRVKTRVRFESFTS